MNRMTAISAGGHRGPVLFLLGIVLLGAVAFRTADGEGLGERPSPVQQVYMSGEITTVTGEVIQTDTLAGNVILVNAWATWCGPCVQEMPAFQRVQDAYKDQGFLVLGISGDKEGPEVVRAFIEELGIRYPVTLAPQPALGHLTVRVRGLPTSFLLGRDGRIAQRVEGVFDEEALRTAVEELLKERAPSM